MYITWEITFFSKIDDRIRQAHLLFRHGARCVTATSLLKIPVKLCMYVFIQMDFSLLALGVG